ncbi:MAG: hypothetical protein QGH42_05235 [Kiritimatiellia bacterium]|jgi:hypothetical protein|nr:hypothetical protein [Kiritimatiellia bacterium]MDP6629950.1 hypothetical protein [Kiritimatiellia bacterium]MDP6810148.1 hypothetical protein [Kiritimatiellia bacterium]MDP7023634.1 hypothetical protein [Kiritimatiellia bacterium]
MMRNRILGIAGLMIRQAVRSRFVFCLFVLMLSLLVGFALTIKGDGTVAGRLQVLLSYARGAVGVVLGIASLWLACGAFSVEIENRRLHLVMVKPVRNVELWIGKWLGIVTVAALMLTVAGLFLMGAGTVALRRTAPDGVDGRTVRQQILVARQRVEAVRAMGEAGEARWELDCPDAVASGASVSTLQYRFVSPLRDQPPIQVHWAAVDANGASLFEADCEAYMDGVNRLDIPAESLPPGERIALVFGMRVNQPDTPHHVTFHPEYPVELYVPTGGFGENLLRTLLLMFCRVALLAALGVTVGTVFTFPVAVFASVAMIMATLVTQFFVFSSACEPGCGHEHHGEETTPQWVEWTGEHLARGVQCVVAPVLHYRVRGRLAGGVAVTWDEVHEAAGVLVFMYGGALCALGCGALRRREIALPV